MNNIKSVLISIRPKWCGLIVNGSKTLEIRKTKPRLQTPFKCYIYCTSSNVHECLLQNENGAKLIHAINYKTAIPVGGYVGNGKVIGEFICDEIINAIDIGGNDFYAKSCMSLEEWLKYTDNHKGEMWCWHISELKIYDKPKELKDFFTLCDMGCELCEYWTYQRVNADEFDMDCGSRVFGCKEVKRPPQSWCYVEEVEGGVL